MQQKNKRIRIATLTAATLLLPASIALGGDGQKGQCEVCAASAKQQSAQQDPSQQSQSFAQQSSDRQSSDGQRQSSARSEQAPEGFVLINERVVYLMGNEPQEHFMAAAQKMTQKDSRGAAAELRIAADYVEMQASRAKEGKLSDVSQKLNTLADKAERGELEPQKLNKVFSKTNAELAKLYHSKAESALEKQNYVIAGHELQNAATSFRQALTWSDQQPNQEQTQAITTASEIAMSLQNERMDAAAAANANPRQAQAEQRQQQQPGEAQQASAQDPRTGTTDAEAQNISEHARAAVQTLGQQLEQFASRSGSDQSSGEAQPAGFRESESRDQKDRPDKSGSDEQQRESKNVPRSDSY